MFDIIKGGMKAVVGAITGPTAQAMGKSIFVSTISLVTAHQLNRGINAMFSGDKHGPIGGKLPEDPVGSN